MISFICKMFVKSEDYQDEAVRERVGSIASFIGMFCNILLFFVKFVMGILSNSIAITSDAFNNLSDSASNIITLLGYKLAAKPADKDHPFGHGRVEYLTSLVIAMIILLVGFELLRDSFDKVLHPQPIVFSWVVLGSLIFSIALKFWMAHFYQKMGNKINSSVLKATTQDSLNDCIATGASVVALILSLFVSWPIDGLMGCFVSVFILYSGYNIIKSTVDELLGKPADKLMTHEIEKLILANPIIVGIHDMIIHDYGPGKLLGSAHVEVNSSMDFLQAHDVVDEVERQVYEKMKIMMTLHMDPIEVDNQSVQENKQMVEEIITSIEPKMTIHDFRTVIGPTHTNLIFDVVVPYECKMKNEEILNQIEEKLKGKEKTYYVVITFDRSFI